VRFFIPGSNDNRHAEERFQQLRAAVEAEVGPVKDERIYSIRFDGDGRRQTVTVGGSSGVASRQGSVLALFEGEGAFYVCQGVPGASVGKPERIDGRNVVTVQKFTALC
jgi:hypothetical protein